jgi:hypothetical protein
MYQLPVVVVRLFNTVGPRQTGRYGMVIPNFVRQALAGEPITVFGEGTQSRAFTYVGDVVTGLLSLAASDDVVGEVFNIGNHEEISMMDLAIKVKALTGSSSEIVLIPYDQAYEAGFEDMPRRVPNPRRSAPSAINRPWAGRDPPAGHRARASGSSFSAIVDTVPGLSTRARKLAERALLRNAKTASDTGQTSSRSKARTCATRSACSARATKCTAARA